MTRPRQMDAHPRVSAIMIFYNEERYIDEAIESVLAQNYDDFELLLVDDGSSDASSDTARGYAHRYPDRIRYLEHLDHANRGMSASRNLGLSHARGEFVAFIDADDHWRPMKLREQVALLSRMPEIDAVCGGVNFWSSHGGGKDETIPTGHVLNRAVRPPEALLNVYPIGKADPPCPSDLLMRRSIVEFIGRFEESFTGSLQLYEDQAFLAKLFLDGTIYFDDSVWLDYRLHKDSCTARVNGEGLQPQVRGYFLVWFEAYLKNTRYRFDPRVRFALLRAMRPYRHPHVSLFGRRIKSLLRQARAALSSQTA